MGSTQIIRDIASYGEQDEPMHRWSMVVDGETVSELWVAIETGEIMQVETADGHGRQGYASALYRQAATEITIYHAPTGHRTPEGDAFALAVGGDALPCTYGCCSSEPDFDDED